MKPMFSLLHISARPEQWEATHDAWMKACDHPDSVEYILAVDSPGPFDAKRFFKNVRVVLNLQRPCFVDACNAAAKIATGTILVVVADDFFPPKGWDTSLLSVIPDLEGAYAVHVDAQDPWPDLMTHPILTRAYYERDRGCRGELLYPDFLSVGCDDDFTEQAYKDGVVLDAKRLKFEHRHPLIKGIHPQSTGDPVYQHTNRNEAWAVKETVLKRRQKERSGQKSICVITPGRPFEPEWLCEWEKLFAYLLGRFSLYRIGGTSNNIYRVRAIAAQACLAQGTPDYVLWIDSDNPPSLDSFRQLVTQMQDSEKRPEMPSIDIIGAWYRYSGPDSEQTYIAAGCEMDCSKQLTEAEVLRAAEKGELLEDIAYIGFGLLLMKGSVLEKLGPQGFTPILTDGEGGFMSDDVSWCERAKQAGYRIFIHPLAFVEHLKLNPVPRAKDAARGRIVSISEPNQNQEIAV
jgi:GT2 family glycosyltransferase